MGAPDLGNLKADSGLQKLNDYLLSRSYISGYTPTQDDVITAGKLLGAPSSSKYPNAYRWYKHIKYFHPSEQALWQQGAIKVETKKQAEEDDIDLFGEKILDAEFRVFRV